MIRPQYLYTKQSHVAKSFVMQEIDWLQYTCKCPRPAMSYASRYLAVHCAEFSSRSTIACIVYVITIATYFALNFGVHRQLLVLCAFCASSLEFGCQKYSQHSYTVAITSVLAAAIVNVSICCLMEPWVPAGQLQRNIKLVPSSVNITIVTHNQTSCSISE